MKSRYLVIFAIFVLSLFASNSWSQIPTFIRGDVDSDGDVDSLDWVLLNDSFFVGVPLNCAVASDVNDDGIFDQFDLTYIFNFLRGAGPPPPEPYPNCGVDPTEPQSHANCCETSANHNINIGDFFFSPSSTVVKPGDTVTWTLVSGTHTTTSDTSSGKSWDSGTMDTSGQKFSVVFEATDGIGPFPYHCGFHPSTMKDTIYQNLPPEFLPVESQCTDVSELLSFNISASDPNGDTPEITATSLPTGASFVDSGNGTGNVQWTPTSGQEGFHTMSFYAYDGVLSSPLLTVVVIVGECSGGNTSHTTSDSVLILSPSGVVSFEITLKDSTGLPVEGSLNAWLDLTDVSGLILCPSQTDWPLNYATEPSSATGRLSISISAGGCTTDSARVMSSYGEIGWVPIKSLDHSGNLRVTAPDFVGDDCNDYNIDGVVDGADWDFHVLYNDISCLDEDANYFTVSMTTIPGPHEINQGDTILVCVDIRNLLGFDAILDSVVFAANSLWGIANPWTENPAHYNIPISGWGSLQLCEEFIIPNVSHGCFHTSVWPQYVFSRKTAAAQAGGVAIDDLNLKPGATTPAPGSTDCTAAGGDSDSDGVCDDDDNCPCSNGSGQNWTDPKTGKTSTCASIIATYANDAGNPGCARSSYSPCDECPPPTTSTVGGWSKEVSKSSEESFFAMFIGAEFGDSLYLYEQAFLPSGWTYETNDTGWVQTPTELIVQVNHDKAIGCEDTGRVIFYAYNDVDEFAGTAEVILYAIGQRGDVNNDGSDPENILDLTYLVDYIFRGGPPPTIFESGDLNHDMDTNILDLTFIVDFIFRGGPATVTCDEL